MTINTNNLAVIDSDTFISVPNPDDPFGMPAWEGAARDAHQGQTPGVYAVVDADGEDYELVVERDDSSYLRACTD